MSRKDSPIPDLAPNIADVVPGFLSSAPTFIEQNQGAAEASGQHPGSFICTLSSLCKKSLYLNGLLEDC